MPLRLITGSLVLGELSRLVLLVVELPMGTALILVSERLGSARLLELLALLEPKVNFKLFDRLSSRFMIA